MNKYATHLFIFAKDETEAAKAPPQLLIDLLEWAQQFCKSLPIPVQHWKTEGELTVALLMHIAASRPDNYREAVFDGGGLFCFFFGQAKRREKPAASERTKTWLHDLKKQ